MNFSNPREVANYREKTNADRTPGIGFFSFKCKHCNGIKPIGGRKKTPKGWKCKDCVTLTNTGETK